MYANYFKGKLKGLTIAEVLKYFPEESRVLAPRELKRLRKELKPWFDRADYIRENYPDPFWQWFYLKVLDMFKPKKKFDHLKNLEIMVKIMRNKDDSNIENITPDQIMISKMVQIEQIYDFKKIKRTKEGFMALCPFHVEKTPSFSVKNNNFICFGCLKKGDVIEFAMKTKGLDFKQAVKFLLSYNNVKS